MQNIDLAELPLPPKNPLPWRQRLAALRDLNIGGPLLRDAGGPVSRLALGPRRTMPEIVLVATPKGAHDMFTHPDSMMERVTTHAEMRWLMGDNLFDVPHDEWLPMRRALQPLFTKKHVATFGGHMAQAAETMLDSWSDGAQVDLDSQCRRLTLRALGRSILGVDLDARADRIAGSLNVALEYIVARATNPLSPPRWLPTPARQRARAAVVVLRDLMQEVLAGCRADPGRDAPLVRALLDVADPETGKSLSDNEIRDQLIVFMGAGHDTTATTLTYALWQLGRHPELQERVFTEVAGLGVGELTADDVPQLPYVRAVLNESLRLCPPGPSNGRTATEDVEIAGYRVPAGTLVIYSLSAVHRDPTLWDRPDEFNPDRFLGPQARSRDRYQFIPFGAGPRSCIGDHFAMLEATLALATIVRKVRLDAVADRFPVRMPFTLVADGPIPVRVTRRA